MSNIFYLMGKSSSGKDTLYRKLMEQNRICVVGSEEKIEQEKKVFEVTKHLL